MSSVPPDLKLIVQALELARRTPRDSTGLWHIEDVNLADANVSAAGKRIGVGTAFGVVALKNGSSPGARVKLTVNGSEFRQFGPGSSFTGLHQELQVLREDGSAAIGTLRLLILDSPFSGISEGDVRSLAPVALLGSRAGGVYNFVAVTEDTDPTNAAANQVGAFDASGFKQIRILIDGLTAAANFTTADLVPWASPDYTPVAGGTWFEQGGMRESIPDTDTSGGRYRVVVVNVTGGWTYYAIRNLLAAARTGLGLYIEGIA